MDRSEHSVERCNVSLYLYYIESTMLWYIFQVVHMQCILSGCSSSLWKIYYRNVRMGWCWDLKKKGLIHLSWKVRYYFSEDLCLSLEFYLYLMLDFRIKQWYNYHDTPLLLYIWLWYLYKLFVVVFLDHEPEPMGEAAWHKCRKMIIVSRSAQKGFPVGHWPIPESFWPDEQNQNQALVRNFCMIYCY